MTTSVMPSKASPALDQLCVNVLRGLSIDMIQQANSGHPGLPLGAAPMAYALWNRFLKVNPKNSNWVDRDRFLLSAGHGSALLYSLLYTSGFNLPLEELKKFRQWNSKTPGHPERGHTDGVDTTTGPLGQGFGNGVGMAIAEAHLAARFNRPGHEIVNHFTYGIVSDGDMMEGIAAEAASLAGHLKLGKLIYLYDSNHITLSAKTDVTFTEDVAKRFESYGWQTLSVQDGNDLDAIEKAIGQARQDLDRPSLIIVRTHIGFGSPLQDTFEVHGSPLGDKNMGPTKEKLGLPAEPFYAPKEALEQMQLCQRGEEAEADWQQRMAGYRKEFPQLAKEFDNAISGTLVDGWDSELPVFEADPKGVSTRAAGGKIMNAIAQKVPELLGGSADLDPSTFTYLKGMGDLECKGASQCEQKGASVSETSCNYAGRNIFFGVREHAMGSIINGMAAHGGTIPYASTFMVFSDYVRPPMRLAGLMALKLAYVFTHDSIGVGEDGPTHQPIEQLASLRAIPRLSVIRPGDANETRVAWQVLMESKDHPTALILTRQNLPTLDRNKFASADGVRQGAYILCDSTGAGKKPDIILIASGSEVQLIVEVAEILKGQNVAVRVVSMPSWDLFQVQDEAYRTSVFPADVKARLVVEAAQPMGWERYVGLEGAIIGIDHFGHSAPAAKLMEEFGFTVDNVYQSALALLKRHGKTVAIC